VRAAPPPLPTFPPRATPCKRVCIHRTFATPSYPALHFKRWRSAGATLPPSAIQKRPRNDTDSAGQRQPHLGSPPRATRCSCAYTGGTLGRGRQAKYFQTLQARQRPGGERAGCGRSRCDMVPATRPGLGLPSGIHTWFGCDQRLFESCGAVCWMTEDARSHPSHPLITFASPHHHSHLPHTPHPGAYTRSLFSST
jgi:hypothetical protein